ncbi:MAG: glycine zipper domain-containing protein [Myxococcota bacterium]
MNTPSNPWKTALIAAAIGIPALGLAVVGGSRLVGDASSERPSVRSEARPSPVVVEDCNAYAGRARDNMRIVKNGAIGGAVGAGVGAAGGAIADGDDGIGKGAGIGALVGATAGALYGLNEENRKSEAARAAYADCIARGGQ